MGDKMIFLKSFARYVHNRLRPRVPLNDSNIDSKIIIILL